MLFKSIFKWFEARAVTAEKVELDVILNSSNACGSYRDRVEWLRKLFAWLQSYSNLAEQSPVKRENFPTIRLKYLLLVLNRHHEWRNSFVITFREVFKDLSSVELFTEVGLSHESSFLSELYRRALKKVLIEGAPRKNLTTLFEKIFPEDEDVEWLDALDEIVMQQFIDMIGTSSFESTQVGKDIEDAIILLIAQVRASGFHQQIRSRMEISDFRKSPFFWLDQKTHQFIMALASDSEDKIDLTRIELLKVLSDCKFQAKSIFNYLDKNGVSVSVIYSIDQLIKQIERIEFLLNLRDNKRADVRLIKMFVLQLVSDLHEGKSIRKFIWHNLQLILRKVVERNSEIGEHYITDSAKDYFQMYRSAAGGGVITAFTVLVKFILYPFSFSPFVGAFVATLNYSTSFLIIHFNQFTLATKQPASTAPVMASKLAHLTDENLSSFVDDMARVIRSQFAAVLGNLSLVTPTILGVSFYYLYATGKPLMTDKAAYSTINSIGLSFPTVIYAAFTGVLLFASSLAAGWIDNWFVLHNISGRVSENEKVIFAVGKKMARASGGFIKRNIAGISGNVVLAFFLGFVPEILKFLGIPLDVRHVTLSTGSIFAAVPTLGWEILKSPEFIMALLGIVAIGILNVSVSFGLALAFSIVAKGIKESRRNLILKEIFKRLVRRPWQFFLPINSKK